MRRFMMAAAGVVVLTCGIARSGPSELLLDPFEERSHLFGSRVIASSFAIMTAGFQEISESAKKKHGPNAQAVLHGNSGKIEITVDGTIVETLEMTARVQEVFGMFLVGGLNKATARFPFSLSVDHERTRPRDADVGQTVRKRFQTQAPKFFEFSETDWKTLGCWRHEPPALGPLFADADPRLAEADVCVVEWQQDTAKTMLVGAFTADGGDWVRDVSRPLCRQAAMHWLEAQALKAWALAADYVGCVLVHDPDHGGRGARDTTNSHLYEVRSDGAIALIN